MFHPAQHFTWMYSENENFSVVSDSLHSHLLLDHQKKQESSRETSISASLTLPKDLTAWITRNCGKLLKEKGIPDHLTCLLRNLYADQEATVRTGRGTTD